MSEAPPIIFRYCDGHMIPKSRAQTDRHYSEGETYALQPYEARSPESHRHFFACVRDAWMNLPEDQVERFPTETHLRKYALVKTGYYDSHSLSCNSHAEALRVAAFLRPVDEFGVIEVRGATVTRYIAKSQSMKAMGKVDFSASKEAVLNFLADMIGTTSKALTENVS